MSRIEAQLDTYPTHLEEVNSCLGYLERRMDATFKPLGASAISAIREKILPGRSLFYADDGFFGSPTERTIELLLGNEDSWQPGLTEFSPGEVERMLNISHSREPRLPIVVSFDPLEFYAIIGLDPTFNNLSFRYGFLKILTDSQGWRWQPESLDDHVYSRNMWSTRPDWSIRLGSKSPEIDHSGLPSFIAYKPSFAQAYLEVSLRRALSGQIALTEPGGCRRLGIPKRITSETHSSAMKEIYASIFTAQFNPVP